MTILYVLSACHLVWSDSEITPWPEDTYVLDSEGPPRVESILKETIKGREARQGIVDGIVGRRRFSR